MLRELGRPISLKVVDHARALWSKRAKVHGLAAALHKQQVVKLLKQLGRGLMNCADDSATAVGNLHAPKSKRGGGGAHSARGLGGEEN